MTRAGAGVRAPSRLLIPVAVCSTWPINCREGGASALGKVTATAASG